MKVWSGFKQDDADELAGTWQDGGIGSYRGTSSAREILAALFSEKKDDISWEFKGNNPLLEKTIEFFRTCVVPVSSEETLEIVAFMEAADENYDLPEKQILETV